MKETKFYICEHCKNIVGMVHNSGPVPFCCGQKMTQLIPGTVEASVEKHLPVVSVEGDVVTVTIGEISHPMTEEHSIQWVYIATKEGGQRKNLVAGDEPIVRFSLFDDSPIAVYAYCNLHGLWMTEL